jgi:hypothetical protein
MRRCSSKVISVHVPARHRLAQHVASVEDVHARRGGGRYARPGEGAEA